MIISPVIIRIQYGDRPGTGSGEDNLRIIDSKLPSMINNPICCIIDIFHSNINGIPQRRNIKFRHIFDTLHTQPVGNGDYVIVMFNQTVEIPVVQGIIPPASNKSPSENKEDGWLFKD